MDRKTETKIKVDSTKLKLTIKTGKPQTTEIQTHTQSSTITQKTVKTQHKRGRKTDQQRKEIQESKYQKEFMEQYDKDQEIDELLPNAAKGFKKTMFRANNFCDFFKENPKLEMKEEHVGYPIWVLPDGHIFLETFHPVYKQATDFLISIAAPESRSFYIHQYQLTPFSLFAAVSVGLSTEDIINGLRKLSKNTIPHNILTFIKENTESYGKVKLVLQKNAHFVETSYPEVLQPLLQDKIMNSYRVKGSEVMVTTRSGTIDPNNNNNNASSLLDMDDEEDRNDVFTTAHSFQVESSQAQKVKKRCIELDYPMLEEYDFRNDTLNPNLDIDLKLTTQIRPYQEKSLSKMFGNGRARSGIIVLPCGAGKSLVGITAACTIKKSCLVLCTNGTSAEQWKQQFRLWSTVRDNEIAKFTSDSKEKFSAESGVIVTTYTMVAYGGKRSGESEKIMNFLRTIEWGLLLLDEVHVVPAKLFRSVLDVTKTHCKLGLTATLVREDNRTDDLNFLIGPKLYEANWMDLSKAGYIASVQCFEVWCPMSGSFYREYLRADDLKMKTLYYVMNPVKFHCTKFLMEYHEKRGDKVIIFADNIWALEKYGLELKRPYIYGKTKDWERQDVLDNFKVPAHKAKYNTILLSKVGDNSIDIPEANVIIQVSSHFGSRRQEAQRLGRILRPKAKSEEEFNAYFYSLVSKDTEEMKYSAKRQQFLIDQGYSFKILTDLPYEKESSTSEEEKLLQQIKLSGADAGAIEDITDQDDISLFQATRRATNLAQLSGGGGSTTYSEHKKGNLTDKVNKLSRKLN